MPTAFEYRAAARRIRDAGDDAGAVAADMRGVANAHGVTGGNLQVVVDHAIGVSTTNAEQLARDCEALAAECDRRAEICEQFAADMAAWTVRHRTWSGDHAVWRISRFEPDVIADFPGPEPREPVKPFAWVEI